MAEQPKKKHALNWSSSVACLEGPQRGSQNSGFGQDKFLNQKVAVALPKPKDAR